MERMENTHKVITIDSSCDICYKEIKDKVTLECKHELCVKCFIEMSNLSGDIPFKCHMCRRQYNWKKETSHVVSNSIEDIV